MRFIRSYSSHTNFPRLTTHHNRLPQSNSRSIHKYPSPISSSLGILTNTHIKNQCSGTGSGNIADTHCRDSHKNKSYMANGYLRTDPILDFSSRYGHNFGLMSSRYSSVGLAGCVNGVSRSRAYSSFFGGGSRGGDDTVVKRLNVDESDGIGKDGLDGLKKAWQSTVDAAEFVGQKAKEASDTLTPHVQQLLDSNPYLSNVIIPVGWTLTGTLLAWLVLPRVLKRFHKYSMQGRATLLPGNADRELIPYESSFWGSLEDPVRYLVTFMAFSQIAVMIAPTTFASQYITPAWRGAIILSFVWFIHRWKTNAFTRILSEKSIVPLDRERMLALDKFSSVGLFVLGLMALAEACGLAVQSVLTVGGIGGVATAFAARDILGNVLSGLSLQFSKPFSLGDTIKAGSIEGQVVEMGFTSTTLLNAEKFPVTVPNSLFSSQAIVNKSRAQWRSMVTKIPLRVDNLEKIPQISNDIKSMLKSNAKIFLGKEAPYCFLSRIESSAAEMTIGCNLIKMSKDELYSTEQDIILHAVRIIKEHGASLGSTQDLSYQ